MWLVFFAGGTLIAALSTAFKFPELVGALLWIVGSLAAAVWYSASRCPRCQQRLNARDKCANCGLRVGSLEA